MNYFLGVEVCWQGSSLHISQTKYIKDLLNRVGLADCKPIVTPMTTSHTLFVFDGSILADPSQYRNIVGALQYCTITRPDISFSVNKPCQFMQSPTDLHWQVDKRLLRCLKGTTSFGLSFHYFLDLQLTTYADTNWASCLDDRRSTSGHCIFFGSNLVSWSFSKQKVVSRFNTKIEYRALANATFEFQWIQHLLQELSISPSSSPIMFYDHISCCQSYYFHSQVKHVELDCHFVWEKGSQ